MKNAVLYGPQSVLSESLSICQNFYERSRGLLWRKALSAERREALLIPKCNSVHTLFMRYPIDVIFLDGAGVITSIRRNLKPWRASLDFAARAVIEAPIDSNWTNALVVGQKLSWQ